MTDRAAIREELEVTRTAFHELVASLSADDWRSRSGNQAWTVGELLWHVASGPGATPGGVDTVRAGIDVVISQEEMDRENATYVRDNAGDATPADVLAAYDAGHAATLAALDAVGDDEWQKRILIAGDVWTVEYCFRYLALHFDEHAADVRRAVASA